MICYRIPVYVPIAAQTYTTTMEQFYLPTDINYNIIIYTGALFPGLFCIIRCGRLSLSISNRCGCMALLNRIIFIYFFITTLIPAPNCITHIKPLNTYILLLYGIAFLYRTSS